MDVFHEKLKNYLRQYYYVGGMPQVVNIMLKPRKYFMFAKYKIEFF